MTDERRHAAAYRQRLDSHLLHERLDKIEAARARGENPFPNGMRVSHTAAEVFAAVRAAAGVCVVGAG